MKTIFVTGANRGLGLELVRQYAAEGWRVIACCREPERAQVLNRLTGSNGGGVKIHKLDVTDPAGIVALAGELQDQPIDIVLNNAGIYGPRPMTFGRADETAWLEVLRVNTIAPQKITESFAGHVARSSRKIVAVMSSMMGSMEQNREGGDYIYRSSKAAVNAVVKSLAIDLRERGITAVALHPGWVRTDMGGPRAPVGVEESVCGLRKVLAGVTQKDTGKFFAYDGAGIPW